MSPTPGVATKSQIESTNEAVREIFHFLFVPNSILTGVHLVILLLAIAFAVWVYRINPSKLGADFPCRTFAVAMIGSMRDSTGALITAFLISWMMFNLAVALDQSQLPSVMVQLLTYTPTIVLALSQLRAAQRGVQTIKQYTGL